MWWKIAWYTSPCLYNVGSSVPNPRSCGKSLLSPFMYVDGSRQSVAVTENTRDPQSAESQGFSLDDIHTRESPFSPPS